MSDWLYYDERLTVKVQPELDVFEQPGENQSHFHLRLQQAARERRDLEVDKLEKKYEKQLDKLDDKMRKLEHELASDKSEYESRKREEMIGVGETVLSFFMGRRRTSAATTIARRRRMTSQVKMDIGETEEDIAELKEDVRKIENELKDAVKEITNRWEEASEELVSEEIKPRRTDVKVHLVALAWAPHWIITYKDGMFPRSSIIPAYPK